MIARKRILVEGQEVRIKWDDEEKGARLIRLGPEQSEVRLANGRTVYLPNRDLEPA